MNKFYCICFFFILSFSGSHAALAFAKNTLSISHGKPGKQLLIDQSPIEKPVFPDLKKKYNSGEFVYEVRSKKKNAWDRFLEWLDGLFGSKNGHSNPKKGLNLFFKIVAGAIILFVIFLIVKAIMNKEGKWIFGKSSDKSILRYNEIEKDLQSVDFEKLIRETKISGEKRLMIRYYYLWLLKRMSAQGYIEWDPEKTNSDYLNELKPANLKSDFEYLSYLYNYIWYGEFDIDEQALQKAAQAFEKTIKSIQS